MTKEPRVPHLFSLPSMGRVADRRSAGWGEISKLMEANYSAAKMGLPGFTRTLALELGKFKITKRKARDGRNPTTGATIKIPDKTTDC